MRRLYVVALVVALAGCGSSPTCSSEPPDVAGAWDWYRLIPREDGGFNENPTGVVVTIQQTGGSLTATFALTSPPRPLGSATGTVTAGRVFTLQMPISSEICFYNGTVDTATVITGTMSCGPDPRTIGFAFRKR